METLERSLHPQSPLQPPIPQTSTLENKISPSILLIIIILAIIFFISGLLHLLVRFLLKPNNRDPDEVDDVTALQGQLQQLFYLHDAGVDQSFIDTLPLFHYNSIIGVKDPFDCAVCLCEFEPEDRLRLLPKCSHAFHTECIDTWLLSHSTCPLCRSNLLEGFSPRSGRMPIVCVLESGSDGSREMGGANGEEQEMGRTNSGFGSDRHLGCAREAELGSSRVEFQRKSSEGNSGEKIVTVKLGKFKNVDGTGESSNNNINFNNNNNVVDSRRCFSMGSFEYVMDENSSLQVPIRTPAKKPSVKKTGFVPLKPGGGFRSAISEYGCDSRREFSGVEIGHGNVNKCESFSVSKIWGRSCDQNKEKGGCSSFVGGRRTHSEIEINVENGGDEDAQSCYSVESSTSTTRRTLLWLMGRQQNKVVHSSLSSSNV